MSLPKKIRAGNPELTRLRELWLTLNEATREYWYEKLQPAPVARELRQQLEDWFQIKLSSDYQLSRFRQWVGRHEEQREKHEESKEAAKSKFMNLERKPDGTASGLPETPMQRMKDLWKKMLEDEQDYWRKALSSSKRLTDLRAEIAQKYEIIFTSEEQVSRLRRWVADQDERVVRAARMQENERQLKEQHPDWTLDQLRKEVLKMAYFETLAFADFKLGLSTARVDISDKSLQLQWEKHEFDACEACLKQLPELKLISNNSKLTDREKINQIRRKLFGKLPEDK